MLDNDYDFSTARAATIVKHLHSSFAGEYDAVLEARGEPLFDLRDRMDLLERVFTRLYDANKHDRNFRNYLSQQFGEDIHGSLWVVC